MFKVTITIIIIAKVEENVELMPDLMIQLLVNFL